MNNKILEIIEDWKYKYGTDLYLLRTDQVELLWKEAQEQKVNYFKQILREQGCSEARMEEWDRLIEEERI